MITTPFHRNN